ncbi:MAG TPA: ester cyclase [Puia sp.]|nr:ester cyclase [Puia sp.]
MHDLKSTLTYKWFQEVWNEGREDLIDDLMSQKSIIHGIAEGQSKGAEGFKFFYRNFKAQFRDIRVDIQEALSQDNLECALTNVTATHKETGTKVSFSGLCMVRFEEGKIAEAWNHYDFLSMHQQLGRVLA